MNWNTVLSTVLSGALVAIADASSNTGGHIDKHTAVVAGVGALTALVNLLRQSPNGKS